ncbi:MAG TPA: hydantoinase B/oxoprolinase family protein [Solirubrobacterales bacterium]|jgi:N-methylhydantoinase B|nr:hydantoinase B/oxoprolinase family protein [Solirubrobacterales bacterium]
MGLKHDVIEAEIHRKAVENLTDEMAIALLRTSGSPVVVDSKDFSTCMLDTVPEHLAFAAYVLNHFGTSLLGTRAIVEGVDPDAVRPGAGWIVNDPYEGGAAHQGDVAIIMPMFYGHEHLGWSFVNMHVLDIGGEGVSGLAPGAHDVYGEGLRFPPIPCIRKGVIEPEWERFIAANVRVPGPVLNDLRSMIASSNVGEQKLGQIVEAFGVEDFRRYCEVNKDLTEAVLRERIERLPDGVYHAAEWDEFDGHGEDLLLEMRLEMEVVGSDLRFRYSGVPQIDGFINCGPGSMWGRTATALLTGLGYGDLPPNGGIWRPLDIDLGEPGSVLNPRPPAPVSDGHAQAAMRAGKMARDVLSQAMALSDDAEIRARVSSKAHDGTPVGPALFGPNQHGGRSVVIYLDGPVGVGGGAQTIQDGLDGYGSTSTTGCGLSDAEAHEAADPFTFLWRRVVPNSGGPGLFHGGQAMSQAYQLTGVDEMGGPGVNSCIEVPPAGFGGGFPAAGSVYYILGAEEAEELLAGGRSPADFDLLRRIELPPNKAGHLTVRRGDVVVVVGGGGGGLGDPLLRSPAKVAEEVRAGYVTAEHAHAIYGVVLGGDGVAEPETELRRLELRRERIGGEPAAEMRAPASVGVAIVRDLGSWCCGSCGVTLASLRENWREGAVGRESVLSERMAELRMFVRPRHEGPEVLLREHYCPSCAAGLCHDVVVEGCEPIRAPELASAGAEAVR